jgi:diadenosine tetraphosphate (Ap4A) HIT family hydrolase
MDGEFVLNERLAGGSFEVLRVVGCRVLLKNEAEFPWFLVVPEVGVEDLHELSEEEYGRVMRVVREVSRFVSGYFEVEKLNVGCIGNVVRQMHIHVVGRRLDDGAWPGLVWAYDKKRRYEEGEAEVILEAARMALKFDC